MSGNTGRVHLHAAPDGSAPLWLSLPMEALLGGDSPPLEELLEAVSLDGGPPSPALAAGPQGQQGQQQGEQAAPAAGSQPTRPAASKQQEEEGQRQHGPPRRPEDSPEHGRERQRPAVIGGIGVLALDRHIGAARLAARLAEAREFAAEWRELRGLHQSRLQGRVLRVPLTEVGAPGTSTVGQPVSLPASLPPASLPCFTSPLRLARPAVAACRVPPLPRLTETCVA